MRELGHFPIIAEIRLKKRTDASLPNDRTYKRFGSKQQFAMKILDYCNGREGYEGVADMCRATLDSGSHPAEERESKSVDGFIYLIRSGRNYKIGRSNSVGRREYELAIQLPDKASTVHTIRTGDPTGIEAYWHKRFEAKRKNGEWFQLTPEDVSAFRRRKYM